MRTNEIKNEIDEIKRWEEQTKQEDLKYKTKNCTYDFQQYETIRSVGESIYTRKAGIVETEENQSNLLETLVKFNNRSRPKNKEHNDKKRDTYESAYALYEGPELTLNAFKNRIFLIKAIQGEGLKILTPKQMLQRLSIALAQVKLDSTSGNLLNEIRKIYILCIKQKKLLKKYITIKV